MPLLSTFAVFAVGFFMRPVGGLLMGTVADRHGRRAALTVTILLMGGSSLLVGLTPTYAAVGVLAPVVLVLARLLQGLSVGGEFAASTTFLVESAGPGRRGLFSSFQYVSTTAGQLVASGIATLLVDTLSDGQMNGWGWRIPFVLGAVLSLVGFWIRQGAQETRSAEQQQAPRPGLFEALRRHPRESLLICGITAGGTIAYYTWTSYLPTYAELNAGVDKSDALLAGTISLAFFGLLQPLGGLLSDRFGRRPLLLFFGLGFALLERAPAARPARLVRGPAARAVRGHGAADRVHLDQRGRERRDLPAPGAGGRHRLPLLADGRPLRRHGSVRGHALQGDSATRACSPGTSPSCACCRRWCICGCRRRPTHSCGGERAAGS